MSIKKKKEKTTIGNLPKKVDGLVTTVNGLSATVSDLAKTVDSLAVITKNGFENIDKKIENLKRDNAREHKEIIKSNEREHEEIKLSLNNVAYHFELVELQKRVGVLERRVRVV